MGLRILPGAREASHQMAEEQEACSSEERILWKGTNTGNRADIHTRAGSWCKLAFGSPSEGASSITHKVDMGRRFIDKVVARKELQWGPACRAGGETSGR